MKTLIVEDDLISRLLLQTWLTPYSEIHTAVNGREAVAAFQAAIDSNQPYDLICMDIMMPEMDGRAALKDIRAIEEQRGIVSSDGAKIIMTTALTDIKNISHAFHDLCDEYLIKPIEKAKLLKLLDKHGFIH